jgi:PAS domain S-box-containing protein
MEKAPKSHGWLDTILEQSPNAIFLKDADGRYLFANKAYQFFFQLTAEQIIGKTSRELFPDLADVFAESDLEVLRSRRAFQYEETIQTPVGVRTCLIQKFPVFADDGTVAAIGGIATDLTERKHAEDTLRASELWFRQLTEGLPIAVYVCDVSGAITQFNQAAAELWGRAPEPSAREPLAQLLRTGALEPNREVIVERPDGSRVTALAHLKSIRNAAGEVVGAVNCLVDITERKQSEAALKQLSKDLLNAHETERKRIARELHDDINQRLALLIVELESLQQELPPTLQPQLDNLSKLTRSAEEILTDIQGLSHSIHSKKLEDLGLVASLADLCRQTSQRFQVSAQLDAIEFNETVDRDMALCLFRVAQEALNNAIKHGRAKQIAITLAQTNGSVELRIKDAGVGFDVATSPGGLGLASMRERLHMVAGQLSVISTPGGGTEVIGVVPWTSKLRASKPTLVLADDHPAMREQSSRLLGKTFEIVAAVPDGTRALESIVELKPAVAVLDIAMPEMSGLEVARRVRALGLPTKLLFLTVGGDPEYVTLARDMGATLVLKHRMLSDLLPAIERALSA